VADNILHARPAVDLRVLAVWQAIDGDGQGGRHPEQLLSDPRVVPLHDPDLAIGRWFGDRSSTFHAGAGVAWDAFLLFDADATFATAASHLEASGSTIIADHAKLQNALRLPAG